MGILDRDDVDRAERLRRALMRAPDFGAGDTFGYDPVLGLVRGGNWDGGPKTGAVLLNAGLICGVALDYWNGQAGERTTIEANVRKPLEAFGYDGGDKREIFFGECPPCVRGSSGQVHFSGEIVTALPTGCKRQPTPDRTGAMSVLAAWIVLLYRRGKEDEARALFDAAAAGWDGEAFSDELDGGAAKSSRALSYFVLAGRLTGFWRGRRDLVREVLAQLWALQNDDGSIRAGYLPGQLARPDRATPESTGLALLAITPVKVLRSRFKR